MGIKKFKFTLFGAVAARDVEVVDILEVVRVPLLSDDCSTDPESSDCCRPLLKDS